MDLVSGFLGQVPASSNAAVVALTRLRGTAFNSPKLEKPNACSPVSFAASVCQASGYRCDSAENLRASGRCNRRHLEIPVCDVGVITDALWARVRR